MSRPERPERESRSDRVGRPLPNSKRRVSSRLPRRPERQQRGKELDLFERAMSAWGDQGDLEPGSTFRRANDGLARLTFRVASPGACAKTMVAPPRQASPHHKKQMRARLRAISVISHWIAQDASL